MRYIVLILLFISFSAQAQIKSIAYSKGLVKYDSTKIEAIPEAVTGPNYSKSWLLLKSGKDTVAFVYADSVKVYDKTKVKVVPTEITMWQLRAAITLSGLKPSLEAALEQLPEPTKTVAKTVWEYANTILRYSPTISVIKQLLGLSDEQVDDLFIIGNNIDA